MATTHARATRRPEDERTDDPVVSRTDSAAPAAISLLDDEHTQSILAALAGGPRRGRELIDACAASRPTVYRRLDSLTEAGLVTAETHVDPDGHHCKQFRLVRDRLTVRIEAGTVTVTARPGAEESEPGTR
jgi:DNA-binding HxlR family transcriptional regulator